MGVWYTHEEEDVCIVSLKFEIYLFEKLVQWWELLAHQQRSMQLDRAKDSSTCTRRKILPLPSFSRAL